MTQSEVRVRLARRWLVRLASIPLGYSTLTELRRRYAKPAIRARPIPMSDQVAGSGTGDTSTPSSKAIGGSVEGVPIARKLNVSRVRSALKVRVSLSHPLKPMSPESRTGVYCEQPCVPLWNGVLGPSASPGPQRLTRNWFLTSPLRPHSCAEAKSNETKYSWPGTRL